MNAVKVHAFSDFKVGNYVTDVSGGAMIWSSSGKIVGVAASNAKAGEMVEVNLFPGMGFNVGPVDIVGRPIYPKELVVKKEEKWIGTFKSVEEARKKLRAK